MFATFRPWRTGLAQPHAWGLRSAAFIIALFVFGLNTATQLHDAFAVLYVLVVLLIATSCGLRTILATGAACIGLSCLSFLVKHHGESFDDAYLRLAVSIIAIGVATMLSARDRRTRDALAEQVRMLAFTHDTVIVRDLDDTIIYWNEGAVRLYGWHADEAIGEKGSALLQSTHLPPAAAEQLRLVGQWTGEITRTRRDGQQIVLDVRWSVRLDSNGRECGIIEFGADLTEQKEAAAERERSEQRYSAIFQAVAFAIFEVDCSVVDILFREKRRLPEASWRDCLERFRDKPYIRDANDAAAALLEVEDPRKLTGAPLRSLFADESVFIAVLAHLSNSNVAYETETTFVGPNRRSRDVVLRVTRPVGDLESRRVLVMALDITEHNQAQMKLRAAQGELAHADRVTTLGQLAVSIAHEVNQPLSAITTFARSGRRWLDRSQPKVGEALLCFDEIVSNSTRAAEVITRVRALTRKETVFCTAMDLGELVEEVRVLLRGEILRRHVEVRIEKAVDTPMVSGDRIQLQQVIMNVMMNAIQAMSIVVDRPRVLEIRIGRGQAGPDTAVLSFCDTGPGFGDIADGQLFEPFVTTKAQGMGMGLPICREIAHAHGGTINALNRSPYGAVVIVTLPQRRV